MKINFPHNDMVVQGLEEVTIPPLYRIRQKFDSQKIDDIEEHLLRKLEVLHIDNNLFGKRIAITAGSRKIPHIVKIYHIICAFLKEKGARPFLVPAMGSHGGATAQGQKDFLAGYGITEESIGAPIISCMDTVSYGSIDGNVLYCDKCAAEADGIIILNKVKPHTSFRGTHESGLAKMIAVGLAKHRGAAAFHHLGVNTFSKHIPEAAEVFLRSFPVVCGIGIVQNAYDEICALEIAPPEELLALDQRLLVLARDRMARLKFHDADLLIIDEIGKDISGLGADPNVTGRTNAAVQGFDGILNVTRIFIAGISEKSHGNGIGLYAADVTTRRCLNSVDWNPTWVNVATSTTLRGGTIPIYVENDSEAIRLCLACCYRQDFSLCRIARIRNTRDLDTIEVSEPLLKDIREREDIEVLSGPTPILFDDGGFLKHICGG